MALQAEVVWLSGFSMSRWLHASSLAAVVAVREHSSGSA